MIWTPADVNDYATGRVEVETHVLNFCLGRPVTSMTVLVAGRRDNPSADFVLRALTEANDCPKRRANDKT